MLVENQGLVTKDIVHFVVVNDNGYYWDGGIPGVFTKNPSYEFRNERLLRVALHKYFVYRERLVKKTPPPARLHIKKIVFLPVITDSVLVEPTRREKILGILSRKRNRVPSFVLEQKTHDIESWEYLVRTDKRPDTSSDHYREIKTPYAGDRWFAVFNLAGLIKLKSEAKVKNVIDIPALLKAENIDVHGAVQHK